MNIYVVAKETGSYSDYSKTLVHAFYSENDADNFTKKQNDEVALCAKARSLQYNHMRKWEKEPAKDMHVYFSIGHQANEDKLNIAGHIGMNRYKPIIKEYLTPEQLIRINELEIIITESKIKQEQYNKLRKQEETDFIRALDFLTDEQKQRLLDYSFETDSHYIVESIKMS